MGHDEENPTVQPAQCSSQTAQDEETIQKQAILIQSCIRRWLVKRLFQRRQKMVAKRKNVAHEVLHTEREYTNNLTVLIEHFLRPALSKENARVMETQLVKELTLSLSGVEVISKFHCTLLQDLEQKLQTWGPPSQLGALFVSMASYLKAYSQYVNHYQNAVQLLAKKKADKALQSMLTQLKPNAAGKGIKDYMIMPIQRIPRYQMLLQELVKATWDTHVDYKNLISAHERVQEVAAALENQSADASSIAKVMELATMMHRRDHFKLVVPYRRYIDECVCEFHHGDANNSMPVTCFLFNDLILYCKPKKDKFVIRHMVSLKSATVIPSDQPGKFAITEEEEESAPLCMSMNEEASLKWKAYFESLQAGAKIWLPHTTVEPKGKEISVQRRETTTEPRLPSPPPLPAPKKKRGLLSFMTKTKTAGTNDSLDSTRGARRRLSSSTPTTTSTRSEGKRNSQVSLSTNEVSPSSLPNLAGGEDSNLSDVSEGPLESESSLSPGHSDLESSCDGSPGSPRRRDSLRDIDLFGDIMAEVENMGKEGTLPSSESSSSLTSTSPSASPRMTRDRTQSMADLPEHERARSALTQVTRTKTTENQREQLLKEIQQAGQDEERADRQKSARTRLEKMKELSRKNSAIRVSVLKEIEMISDVLEEEPDDADTEGLSPVQSPTHKEDVPVIEAHSPKPSRILQRMKNKILGSSAGGDSPKRRTPTASSSDVTEEGEWSGEDSEVPGGASESGMEEVSSSSPSRKKSSKHRRTKKKRILKKSRDRDQTLTRSKRKRRSEPEAPLSPSSSPAPVEEDEQPTSPSSSRVADSLMEGSSEASLMDTASSPILSPSPSLDSLQAKEFPGEEPSVVEAPGAPSDSPATLPDNPSSDLSPSEDQPTENVPTTVVEVVVEEEEEKPTKEENPEEPTIPSSEGDEQDIPSEEGATTPSNDNLAPTRVSVRAKSTDPDTEHDIYDIHDEVDDSDSEGGHYFGSESESEDAVLCPVTRRKTNSVPNIVSPRVTSSSRGTVQEGASVPSENTPQTTTQEATESPTEGASSGLSQIISKFQEMQKTPSVAPPRLSHSRSKSFVSRHVQAFSFAPTGFPEKEESLESLKDSLEENNSERRGFHVSGIIKQLAEKEKPNREESKQLRFVGSDDDDDGEDTAPSSHKVGSMIKQFTTESETNDSSSSSKPTLQQSRCISSNLERFRVSQTPAN